jgi:uncharacterized protein YeaO (DUF488 family)
MCIQSEDACVMAKTRTLAERRRRIGGARARSGTRVQIRRVYDEPSSGEGVRVLIDRLWPRGIAKAARRWERWMPEIAPSNELRKWYGHDPARFGEFERRYRDELAGRADAIAALRSEARGGGVTLLTATREPALSHATVLQKLLSRGRSPRR